MAEEAASMNREKSRNALLPDEPITRIEDDLLLREKLVKEITAINTYVAHDKNFLTLPKSLSYPTQAATSDSRVTQTTHGRFIKQETIKALVGEVESVKSRLSKIAQENDDLKTDAEDMLGLIESSKDSSNPVED